MASAVYTDSYNPLTSPELPSLPMSDFSSRALQPSGLPSHPSQARSHYREQSEPYSRENDRTNNGFDYNSTYGAPTKPQSYDQSSREYRDQPPSGTMKKKVNPLMDLIKTEGQYVEDLSVIIKRVAAAWSRTNFPPPELDAAFRAVEQVYRTNKALLAKLDEIGPTPASPKALGDLLMSWVPEIEPAYSRYVENFKSGFDHFEPVQLNDKLHTTLAALDWPDTLPLPSDDQGDRVTIDVLFQLPFERIRYYKKLFGKLLKSTQEGKSDYDLLVAANDTLDQLLARSSQVARRQIGSSDTLDRNMSQSTVDTHHSIARGSNSTPDRNMAQRAIGSSMPARGSYESGSGGSSSDRFSSTSSAATSTSLPRIEDLERRLCTERALDIFTMKPKKCKLQMAAPNLTFTRALRRAADVKISFYPLSDPDRRELILSRPYIFLLTDLFLICSRMSPEERAMMKGNDGEGPDMWLLYPPLAGKHLRVADGMDEGELEVTVMKKEKLFIRTESAQAAAEWKAAFEDAISFGTTQGLRVKTDIESTARGTPGSAATIQSAFPISTVSGLVSGRDRDNSSRSSPAPRMSNSPPLSSPRYDERNDLNMSRGQSSQDSTGEYNQMGPPPPRRDFYAQSNSSSNNSLGPYQNGQPPSPSVYVSRAPESANYTRSAPNFSQSPLSNFTSPSTGESSNGPYTPPGSNTPQQQYSNDPYYKTLPQPLPIPNYELEHANSFRSTNSSFASGQSARSSAYPEAPMPAYGQPFMPPYANSRGPTSLRTDPGDDDRRLSPSRYDDIVRSRSAEGFSNGAGQAYDPRLRAPYINTSGPSSGSERTNSAPGSTYGDYRNDYDPRGLGGTLNGGESPPLSPLVVVPDTTSIVASMRCKVFLQQHHAQWKSLGTAKLKLFLSVPSNTKQLVVESDKSDKKVFVSTIVLTDGVEKVGKTGVAIELSDSGSRTGIIYMLQMKTEQSAMGLFDQLLLNSDRGAARHSNSR